MGNLIESKIYIEEVKSAEHLNTDDKQLVEKAIEAAKMAYAPYSNFNVGAAVLLENGTPRAPCRGPTRARRPTP